MDVRQKHERTPHHPCPHSMRALTFDKSTREYLWTADAPVPPLVWKGAARVAVRFATFERADDRNVQSPLTPFIGADGMCTARYAQSCPQTLHRTARPLLLSPCFNSLTYRPFVH